MSATRTPSWAGADRLPLPVARLRGDVWLRRCFACGLARHHADTRPPANDDAACSQPAAAASSTEVHAAAATTSAEVHAAAAAAASSAEGSVELTSS
jgi:hypothetical protein